MCRSVADGGLRCASHTRPAYNTARFGTPAWDEAAAEYAATSEGRAAVTAVAESHESRGDIDSAERARAAIRSGEQKRAVAQEVSEQVKEFREHRFQKINGSSVMENLDLSNAIWDGLAQHSKYRAVSVSMTVKSSGGQWHVEGNKVDTTGSFYNDQDPVVVMTDEQITEVNKHLNDTFEADHDGATARVATTRTHRDFSSSGFRFSLYVNSENR